MVVVVVVVVVVLVVVRVDDDVVPWSTNPPYSNEYTQIHQHTRKHMYTYTMVCN